MDELLAEFIAETRETYEAIAGEIVAWEKNPGDRTRLDSIFRFIHTVKGSSGFLDLPRLQKLSHEAESALSEVRAGEREAAPALVTAILAVIDRISAIVAELENGKSDDDADDADLFAMLEQRSGVAEPGARTEPAATPVAPSQPVRTIRVPVELLDQLMNGVSDLVLSRNELSRQLRRIPGDAALTAAFDKISHSVTEMRDAISWTRMQRIENLFTPLPRLVRDLSSKLDKSVSLQLVGSDVELDRELIEMLRDPLVHIVRNALDHGIESKADRIAAGKNPKGVLRVSARQSGNRILVEIFDDGAGVAGEKLVEKAVGQGILTADEAAALNEEQRLALIFEPGLSTAIEVSAVSGRGVGMDIVRANVERVGGSVEIRSEAGKSSTIILQLPLTLTIIPALIAGIGNRGYAIPRQPIDRIVSLAKGQARIERIGGAIIALVDGRRMPAIDLVQLLSGEDADCDKAFVVTLKLGKDQRYALILSSVFQHEDLVAKPVAPVIAAAGIYAGAALPDSGTPLLLLDPVAIAERAGLRLSDVHNDQIGDEFRASGDEAKHVKRLLVFDDLDGVRRALPMDVVEHIDQVSSDAIIDRGGKPHVMSQGAALPLEAVGELPDSGQIKLLRLHDGATSLCYAISGEADVLDLADEIRPAPRADRIAGFAVAHGHTIEVIDAHALFAGFADAELLPHGTDRPKARLAGGDERWRRDFLAPLVESAGYEAVFDDAAGDADVTLDLGASEPGAGDVINLSPIQSPRDGRIYRYDRDAIYEALRAQFLKRGQTG
ncbi:MAG: chemotaxis protein CheA [Sphingomonadaceae bacterium]|nr:chemotaxis protein CheA [Sphingomonadaceae bacterium]